MRDIIEVKKIPCGIRLEETKENLDLVKSMFRDELREEARMQEECYRCPYHNSAPCVGICWKRLLSGRETI